MNNQQPLFTFSDNFVKIRLIQRRLKNLSKENPGWFSYIIYNSTKGFHSRSLKKFGIMAHGEKKILNFINKLGIFP